MYILTKIRKKLGLSSYAFAKLLEINAVTLWDYEGGRRKPSDKMSYYLIDKVKKIGYKIGLEDLRPRSK